MSKPPTAEEASGAALIKDLLVRYADEPIVTDLQELFRLVQYWQSDCDAMTRQLELLNRANTAQHALVRALRKEASALTARTYAVEIRESEAKTALDTLRKSVGK